MGRKNSLMLAQFMLYIIWPSDSCVRCRKFSALRANLKRNAQSGHVSPERGYRVSLIVAYSAFTVSPRPLNSPTRDRELYLHSDGCHRLLTYVLVRLPASLFCMRFIQLGDKNRMCASCKAINERLNEYIVCYRFFLSKIQCKSAAKAIFIR